jgi:hypothetical protein
VWQTEKQTVCFLKNPDKELAFYFDLFDAKIKLNHFDSKGKL